MSFGPHHIRIELRNLLSVSKDLNGKRSEIEMGLKEKRARMRMSVNFFGREKEKIKQIENKVPLS